MAEILAILAIIKEDARNRELEKAAALKEHARAYRETALDFEKRALALEKWYWSCCFGIMSLFFEDIKQKEQKVYFYRQCAEWRKVANDFEDKASSILDRF